MSSQKRQSNGSWRPSSQQRGIQRLPPTPLTETGNSLLKLLSWRKQRTSLSSSPATSLTCPQDRRIAPVVPVITTSTNNATSRPPHSLCHEAVEGVAGGFNKDSQLHTHSSHLKDNNSWTIKAITPLMLCWKASLNCVTACI